MAKKMAIAIMENEIDKNMRNESPNSPHKILAGPSLRSLMPVNNEP